MYKQEKMGIKNFKKLQQKENGESESEEEDQQESEWEDDDNSGSEEEVDANEKATKREAELKIQDEVFSEQYPVDSETSDVRMVLVVREDLKMGKGKIGAQCGHATLGVHGVVRRLARDSTYWKKVLDKWNENGMQKKICLKVNTEAEL